MQNAGKTNAKQEAVTTACTRGFNIFAKFCCSQIKANFCSHLLASVVHFTVVKSQATLLIRLEVALRSSVFIIRLGVAEVISAVTLYLLPASKRQSFYLVGYVQVQQFCVWTLLIDRRFDSNDVSV